MVQVLKCIVFDGAFGWVSKPEDVTKENLIRFTFE